MIANVARRRRRAHQLAQGIAAMQRAMALTGTPRYSPAAARETWVDDLSGGFFIQPMAFEGNNKIRVFQEEIFEPSHSHVVR